MPDALKRFELDRGENIPIPGKLASLYSRYRPTPLFRATAFERALGTKSEIFIKDESRTLTGNHKANSAYLIAYLCSDAGIRTITTETTGNWGLAIATAAKEFGLDTIAFLDATSDARRPTTRREIESQGGRVVIVEDDQHHNDLLTLSADAAIQATQRLRAAAYVFGSVYGYFVVPQSMMGIEAGLQLAEMGRYPDVVIGSCGGGANLLGIAAPFLLDALARRTHVRTISAESVHCPILTNGTFGFHSIDSLGSYPAIETYGLRGLLGREYIGGLGSTIVASAAAHFHSLGLIEPRSFNSRQALAAARLFERVEGRRVALETAYQLAAVVEEAERDKRQVILVNISHGQNDAAFYLT
jgi:tryptophan synthase beta chain